MVCEPHRYLMSRVAGYSSITLPTRNYDISTQYNTNQSRQYQGSERTLFDASYAAPAPDKEGAYRLQAPRLYDFGSVRSPAISAARPQRLGRKQQSASADISDLPIIKQAGNMQDASAKEAFAYHGLSTGNDYSMAAAGINQRNFEMEKQSLARTIMTELDAMRDTRSVLTQTN